MYFLSKTIIKETFSYSQWYSYSSVRKFVIKGTDENGKNWYMTNNNQFTVLYDFWQYEGCKCGLRCQS